jgi:hypothetical protein
MVKGDAKDNEDEEYDWYKDLFGDFFHVFPFPDSTFIL